MGAFPDRVYRTSQSRVVPCMVEGLCAKWHNLYAHGRWNVGDLPGRRELAGCLVDVVRDDGIRSLIGREEESATRVDGKVPGSPPPGRFVPDVAELAVRVVDGKNHDAVVSTIGAIDEL